ncbi:hypothetical protein ACYOEI_16670, partial [Singulisphaera rosea]
PLHLDWPGDPFTAIATWPVVWIPALLAPIGIALHVVSILQALASPDLHKPIRLSPFQPPNPEPLP